MDCDIQLAPRWVNAEAAVFAKHPGDTMQIGMKLGAAWLLIAFLSACSTASGPVRPEHVGPASDGPDAEVGAFRLHALEVRLQTMPPGGERDYLAGILASRSGRLEEAIRLLNGVLPGIRESQPERAAIVLEALADVYASAYQYGDAARVYDDLEQHFARHLHHDIAGDAALARLLVHVPPQTIEWNAPVRVAMSRNPIGSLVSEFTINGVREQWLLDTGANYSVVTRRFAERLGVTPLAGSAMVGSGLTGLKSPLQAAILPQLQVGGAVLSNVVLVILDDANLRIGSGADAYQINAILGYPVLRALGRITFTQRGEFLAGEAAHKTPGVPMFMRGLTPAIECEIEGQRLLFTFDTGASSTDFSVRYYQLFRQRKGRWRTRRVESGGAGGTVRREMYIQPDVVMRVGDKTVTLRDVTIFPARMNAGIDVLFGNIGQDFVANFESFTLDFVNMTFSLGFPLPAHS